MLPILLYRQDARHIGKRNIIVIFHQVSKEIQVFFLAFFIILTFSEHCIPFIKNNDKLP